MLAGHAAPATIDLTMHEVWITGVGMTRIGRRAESLPALMAEAAHAAKIMDTVHGSSAPSTQTELGLPPLTGKCTPVIRTDCQRDRHHPSAGTHPD